MLIGYIKRLIVIVISICLLSVSKSMAEVMVFSEHNPQRLAGSKPNYSHQLLRLALEKTLHTHGPYRIERTPAMSRSREIQALRNNRYENYFIASVMGRRLKFTAEVTHVDFPLMLGLLGYRVCFYPADKKHQIAQALENNFQNIVFGQGVRWPDVSVLRYNSYKVYEVESYQSLFKMTAFGRIDLFCRSINEVKDEVAEFGAMENLELDKSFAFHYDYPMFFFTHRDNKAATERVKKGLNLAYLDGSLLMLWHEYYAESVRFADVKNRKIIRLENPYMQGSSREYKKYFKHIEAEKSDDPTSP